MSSKSPFISKVIDFSDLIVNDQRRDTEREATENAVNGNDENMRNPFVLMQVS